MKISNVGIVQPHIIMNQDGHAYSHGCHGCDQHLRGLTTQ